jgi:hypothetical protein
MNLKLAWNLEITREIIKLLKSGYEIRFLKFKDMMKNYQIIIFFYLIIPTNVIPNSKTNLKTSSDRSVTELIQWSIT